LKREGRSLPYDVFDRSRSTISSGTFNQEVSDSSDDGEEDEFGQESDQEPKEDGDPDEYVRVLECCGRVRKI
jgi:hypothetical protein